MRVAKALNGLLLIQFYIYLICLLCVNLSYFNKLILQYNNKASITSTDCYVGLIYTVYFIALGSGVCFCQKYQPADFHTLLL
jgi:hypothetical protein